MDDFKAELILNQHSTVQFQLPADLVMHGVNVSFNLRIIKQINRIRKFKNFLFYISERVNLNNPGGMEFFHNFFKTFPFVPRLFMRHASYSPKLIRDLISTPTLVLIYTTSQRDPIMEVAAQSLQGVRWLKTIFVLLPLLKNDADKRDALLTEVRKVLEWTWSKQFTSVLLLTIENSLFVLNPYPTLSITNRTDTWRAEELDNEHREAINTKGYQISTPILSDLPRVFRGVNPYEVFGTSANFFHDYLEFINASMVDTSANLTMKVFDLPNLLELVVQGVYETLIHSFTDIVGNYSVSISEPIGINDWCLMVPYNNASNQELFVREALQDSVWLLLLLAVSYMSFAIWLCSPRRPRDLSGALLQCICSITNNPPLSIIKPATLRMRFLYVILFIMGLNSSNMYISKMASYLTSAPPFKQVDTVQDVIDADLRVLVQEYEYDGLLRSPHLYTKRFLQQVEIVSAEFMQYHRDAMNASFAFMVSTDRWEFVSMQQAHLTNPIYRLTSICSGPFYHVFPMHLDSHLRSSHQNFIMIAQQAGLEFYWKREAFWEAHRLHHFQLFTNNEEPVPLSMGFLSSMVRTWCFGLVVAGVAFVLEMKWLDLKNYAQQLKSIYRRWKSK